MSNESQEFQQKLKQLLEQNQKIDAVKLYRERTGADLKDAKEAIEALQRGEMPPSLIDASEKSIPDDALKTEIARKLEHETLIPVIKYYRKQTGCGLKDAKEAVEQIAEEQGIEAKGGMGCFGMILFLLTFSGGTFAVFTG